MCLTAQRCPGGHSCGRRRQKRSRALPGSYASSTLCSSFRCAPTLEVGHPGGCGQVGECMHVLTSCPAVLQRAWRACLNKRASRALAMMVLRAKVGLMRARLVLMRQLQCCPQLPRQHHREHAGACQQSCSWGHMSHPTLWHAASKATEICLCAVPLCTGAARPQGSVRLQPAAQEASGRSRPQRSYQQRQRHR